MLETSVMFPKSSLSILISCCNVPNAACRRVDRLGRDRDKVPEVERFGFGRCSFCYSRAASR
jgi:hypothetical protein